MRTVYDVGLDGKVVLMRADFDVPVKDGKVENDKRLREATETIQYIMDKGAKKLVLIGHMGRPEGKVVEELRLDPVRERLEELTGFEIAKVNDCINVQLPEAEVVLLENVRFHPEEESNDQKQREEYAMKILQAAGAQLFVNNAFAVMHREQATIYDIAKIMGEKAVAGLVVQKEIEAMKPVMEKPEQPFYVVLGGAKVKDKAGVIENLYGRAAKFLIGGKMALAFLKAKGSYAGAAEEDKKAEEFRKDVELAKKLLSNDTEHKIMLPVDVLTAAEFSERAKAENTDAGRIKSHYFAPDIGVRTTKAYTTELGKAATIVHSGPMGVFEMKNFEAGTRDILRFIAGLKAKAVVGGGDTTAAIEKFGLAGKYTHESTGGSAMLEFFAGKELPGLKVLGYEG